MSREEPSAEALVGLPKAELHRHLEGALRAATIAEVAGTRTELADLPTDPAQVEELIVLQKPLGSLQEVLDRFTIFQRTFVDTGTARRAAREAIEDAHADGLIYVEIRFSPEFMAMEWGLDTGAVLDAVAEGLEEGCSGTGVVAALLLTTTRELGVESCSRTVALARSRPGAVHGVDLAGSEAGWPVSLFERPMAEAREAGLKVTIHCGEEGDPGAIADAIEVLGADRIGHGIQAYRDQRVMELLAETGVPLEVCPTSNWIVGAVPSVEEHPLPSLMEAGVRVTINTDDPALFGITLSEELARSTRAFGLERGDLVRMQLTALEAGFGPEEGRRTAMGRIEGAWSSAGVGIGD